MKRRVPFDAEKFLATRAAKRSTSNPSVGFGGGEIASLQDVQVSQDRRRFKSYFEQVELAPTNLRPSEDAPMDWDFGLEDAFDDSPAEHLPANEKPPRKRYFVSVSFSYHSSRVQLTYSASG